MNSTKTTVQAVAEWSRVFPKQATENYSSSVTFMKQLTVIAISTITYLKNAFPKDSYMVESFGGIKLRILKAKCRNEIAQFLSNSLIKAFEAFNRRYLHQLALCFYEEECNVESLIECHIFEYSYHKDGVTMSMHSKNQDNVKHTAKFTFDNVRKKTIKLIKSCVVLMESCQNKLPATYYVSLRLYYNEDAPWNYQAPGYQATEDGDDHLAGILTGTVRLGRVDTAYHKLVARSYIKDTAKASHEAIASQNPPPVSSEDVKQLDALSVDGKHEGTTTDAGETRLRCPCNLQEDARGADLALLTCYYCRTRQHAVCFGVRSAHAGLVTRHCCTICHYAVRTRLATDDKLTPLSTSKRESLCIFRRTLEWCSQVTEVDAAALVSKFGISDMSTYKLMKLLLSHKIIQPQPGHDNDFNTPYEIQEDQLKSVINRFFHSTDEGKTGNEMEVEMLALQVSNSDAASEVLSELRNVSLQSSTNTSMLTYQTKGVTDIEEDVVMEESTLDQYSVKLANKEVTLDDSERPDRSVKRIIRRPGLRSGAKTKRIGTINK